jgi:hypothetical protein
MSGQLEQGGMETDGVAVALHNNAFEIVVEDDPRDPGHAPKASTWPRRKFSMRALRKKRRKMWRE